MITILIFILQFQKISWASTPYFEWGDNGTYLKLEIINESYIHFEYGVVPVFPDDAIGTTPMVQEAFKKQAKNSSIKLLNEHFELNVSPGSLCFSIYDIKQGLDILKVCQRDMQKTWKNIELFPVYKKNIYGLGQYFRNPNNPDGDWSGDEWDPKHYTLGNAMLPFLGGANGNMMIPVVYFLGEKKQGLGLFLDHTYKQHWKWNRWPFEVGTWGDQIRGYIFTGESLAQLRKSFMAITGHPPMPPKEVFGLWLSKFGYRNWQEIYTEVIGLRSKHFPLDGIVMDLQWFGGRFYPPGDDVSDSKMGTLDFDKIHFPDPQYNLDELKNIWGVKTMLIQESYISEGLPEFKQMGQRGYLARDCDSGNPSVIDQNPWWGIGGMIDWTNPYAASYWYEQKILPLTRLGLEFQWTDLGEPEMFNLSSCYWGMEIDKGSRRFVFHQDIHNIYNLKWSEALYENHRSWFPDRRNFILSRSGTAGSWRYGVGFWSGDIASKLSAYNSHLNAQIHMSLSGVDYYGSDVGGFHRRDDILDGNEDELYTRWFANSSLIDFPLRPHVWDVESRKNETSPIKIGHAPSNLFNIQRRYQLFPYYYSLAYAAYKEGSAIIRPMVYDFQENLDVRNMGEQKMVGPYLMTSLMTKYQQKNKLVYLPKGRWVNTSNNQIIEGNNNFQGPFDLVDEKGIYHAPVFLRHGAIVPMFSMDEVKQSRNLDNLIKKSRAKNKLDVHIVPDQKKSVFDYFVDDYTSNGYEKGEGDGDGEAKVVHFSQEKRDDQILIFVTKLVDFPHKMHLFIHDKTSNIIKISINNKDILACTNIMKKKSIDNCYYLVEENLFKVILDLTSL